MLLMYILNKIVDFVGFARGTSPRRGEKRNYNSRDQHLSGKHEGNFITSMMTLSVLDS